MEFKSYSEKSKARRALVQVYGFAKENTDIYLTVVDGKNGFYVVNGQPVHEVPVAGYSAPATEFAHTPEAKPADDTQFAHTPAADALAFDPVNGTGTPEQAAAEAEAAAPAPSAFGAFALSQLTASSNTEAAKPAPQRPEGLRIQKDRETRNGVTERSKGGQCRLVWDTVTSMCQHDEAAGTMTIPSSAAVRKVAEEKGWNINNTMIEYYQWRKFHGVIGRGQNKSV